MGTGSGLGFVVRHVRDIASERRTPASNRDLALLLTFTAGLVNSVGFLAVAIYTSHMTGLTAMLADHLVLGDLDLVLLAGLGVAAFVVGAMIAAIVFNWARRRGLRSRYAIILVAEALLVLLVGLLAQQLADRGIAWPIVVVLSAAMGLQNAIITKLSGAQIRTTHVTGMVTDIGIELGKLAYRNRRGEADPVRADGAKLRLHLALVGGFFAGGVTGAALGLGIGFFAVIPPAALLLAVASIPVIDDVRSALRARRASGTGTMPT